jgi:acyl-CoA synthetase (AMP-forming)/AMP-acid ligase II
MSIPRLFPDELGSATESERQPLIANAIAFLQYTSGSTADPKGVVVGHENLASNIRAIIQKFQIDEGSVLVSWLPMHHDMGLIGKVLTALYCGSQLVMMTPVHFVQKPARWLKAIARFGGTHSGGPDFAYRFCAQRIGESEAAEIDLSSWQIAFSGSEPVRAETIDRFCATFSRSGFQRASFYSCYGLAEATLFATGSDGRRLPVVKHYSREQLSLGVAQAATDGAAGLRLISCGWAAAGHDVAIVDPETGMLCPDNRVGEICIRGPSVTPGYWNASPEDRSAFNCEIPNLGPGFLRTGDLGFVEHNELYIVGRLKDVVVVSGRKVHPADLERTSEAVDTGSRLGSAVVFSEVFADTQRVILLQEVRHFGTSSAEAIIRAIVRALVTEHDVRPFRVALVPAACLPKTTSGKLRRLEARNALNRGDIPVLANYVGGSLQLSPP